MAIRITAKERRDAAQPLFYLAVPGPSVPHHRAHTSPHISTRPDVYLPNGRTLVQPRLPPLLDRRFFNEDNAPEETPAPDSAQHARKRSNQWRRWQQEVIPPLIPHFVRALYLTKSLRYCDTLVLQARRACTGDIPCASITKRKIALVRFSSVEDIELEICECTPAAIQLMKYGAFPCAPFHPSLVVDLRVLKFTMNLFVQIAPNNTALSTTLERCLGSMGFQLDHQNSLRRRFGNCLLWYIHLRNQTKEQYSTKLEEARATYLDGNPQEIAQEEPASDAEPSDTDDSSSDHSPKHIYLACIPTVGATPAPHTSGRLVAFVLVLGLTHTQAPLPFPEPSPRTRPSEYLRRRCPACFGGVKHDPAMIADVNVCIDACFTQKKRKSPRDPPRTHPKTHFVPEEDAARTEAYVDEVWQVEEKRAKRQKAMEDALEAEDGYEHPELLLPRSVLDGCEASFKAADEKQEKASTKFFEDTAIMGLLCRHDRVLWLVNMHSAGEKKFNVVVLMETLFQQLPLNITVGLLYDVACSFERTCRKWGFLGHFMDRLAFTLLYHPRKRKGFGFTNGEGCERFWHSISHLIANLRICGYYNRLYTLDVQIEHADDASLTNLGEWIWRRHLHSMKKRTDATAALARCGKPVSLLREQWALQVKTQTKPLPRRSKNKGQQAVNAVMLMRTALKVRRTRVTEIRNRFLDAVQEEDPEAPVYQVELAAAEVAVATAESQLRNKEAALGVSQRHALHTLATSQYLRLRMNARALKRRLHDRLRSRKFELDKVECSFRRLVNDQKLYSHTESAVKRREPTISKVNADYNKLCGEITKLVQEGKAPRGAVAPQPIPAKGIGQLDVDDGIWQDVGLDDDDAGSATEPLPWLSDEKVRSGIKAMLELDWCGEEDGPLKKERCSLQEWFAEEWAIVNIAIKTARKSEDRYQLQLLRNKLAALPPWGPAAAEISACVVDAHVAARGEDRHYGRNVSDDEEGEDSGGKDEDFGTLDAVETADIYRNAEERSSLY
ncbi:hypothetical protein B0H17DRAFT_1203476 [Mycena rosella]|uniref:CxC1-like cysteine cluster associated with KDZ transposases domain-containing protein n=1 Tax=Mycena rosella TaxID=1033263 RepID=A0AAD7GEW3_MYCRO|nr:hypothetical protein B0H17DRAFT_1203476 [Mycena rosella]